MVDKELNCTTCSHCNISEVYFDGSIFLGCDLKLMKEHDAKRMIRKNKKDDIRPVPCEKYEPRTDERNLLELDLMLGN